MRAITGERQRFGYRRIGLMLKREGVVMNHKKLRRLYREERLSVHCRKGRKCATGTRQPMPVPDGPGQRWSLDFLLVVWRRAPPWSELRKSMTWAPSNLDVSDCCTALRHGPMAS